MRFIVAGESRRDVDGVVFVVPAPVVMDVRVVGSAAYSVGCG